MFASNCCLSAKLVMYSSTEATAHATSLGHSLSCLSGMRNSHQECVLSSGLDGGRRKSHLGWDHFRGRRICSITCHRNDWNIFFCGAVIMSILLSLIVDAADESDRTRVDEESSTREKAINELGIDLHLTTNNPPNQSILDHPVSLPTMQRLVYGGVQTPLHAVLGIVRKQEYSLISLVATTGDAGGWDKFLMVTFGIFVVIGPLIRSVALTLHVIIGLPVALLGDCIEQPRRRTSLRMIFYRLTSTIQKALRPFIDATGAFCSWEVLIIALLMIQAEMPSITNTIYEDDRCMEADPEHGRTCIEVQFNTIDNFLLICIAWAVLIAASWLVLDLALSEEGYLSLDSNKRYEYGMTIPRRTRANHSSEQSWKGALRDGDISDSGSGVGAQLTYSPLHQHESSEEIEPLEEIVFI
ncbi:hypothetical protein ACHAWX_005566 [Stephanocyclus meneghinianus]